MTYKTQKFKICKNYLKKLFKNMYKPTEYILVKK